MKYLLFLVLLITSNLASATVAGSGSMVTAWKPQWGGTQSFGSVSSVCGYDINLPSWSSSSPGCSFSCLNVVQGATSGSYTVHAVCALGTTFDTQRTAQKVTECPVGFTLVGGNCIPAVVDPCASKKDTFKNMSVGPYDTAPSAGAFYDACEGGCKVEMATASLKTLRSTGKLYAVGSYAYTGKSCTSGEPAATLGDPGTEENPDPKGDDVISKSCTDNPGGGHTTKYTITHSDGSEDYEYINLAGTCAGANDDPDAEKDYCRENPSAPACKDYCADNPTACVKRNADKGFCDAPPVCSGDEIDCASLFQQWSTRCAFETDAFTLPETPPKTPQELADLENKKVTDLLDNGAAVAAYENFKLMNWSTWIPVFPAASCSPFTGTVAGRSVSIDVCSKIAMLNELIGWLFAVYGAWTVVSMVYRKE